MTEENKQPKKNKGGRPKGSTQSHRRLGANRLRRLLTSLESLADESIITAAELMNDESQSGATRLKAAMHLMKSYVDLTGEVYFEQLPRDERESKGKSSGSEDDSEDDEDQSSDNKLAFFSKAKTKDSK